METVATRGIHSRGVCARFVNSLSSLILFLTFRHAMMLSTPTASAQHAQHAQLPRAVRSTYGPSGAGNQRPWRRRHWWHPVWMALARKKLLRRCGGKKWVAPTIPANLGGEEIQVALGAVEQSTTGRVLYGQIFRDGNWCPVKLMEKEPNLWISGPGGPGGPGLRLSLDALASRSLQNEAPGWPSQLVEDLGRWPLKGPGTVVFDAHFFVQRGVSAVLSSGFPVLFVGAAQRMGLVTEDWIPGIAKQLKNRSLCEVFGSSTTLEEMIQDLPEDLRKGHFDIASAIAGADEERWSQVCTVEVPMPQKLSIESCSWTLGAMLREAIPKVDVAVGDVLLKINGQEILWQKFDDIQELLVNQTGSAEITFGRPKVIQKIYLREAVASQEALSRFGVDDVDVDGKVLVSQLSAQLSTAADGLVFAEDRPGLFAGDAGTASHLHVDRKPLLQFCHGLHGCKFFCVAPGKSPGPQVPWQRDAISELEAKLPTDGKPLSTAAEWMQSPEVSICCLHPGDLLLFLGQSCHAGCNGAAQISLSLFHGTMPLSYMLQGAFGVPYQLMARKMMS
eukprot:s1090_g3.t1